MREREKDNKREIERQFEREKDNRREIERQLYIYYIIIYIYIYIKREREREYMIRLERVKMEFLMRRSVSTNLCK